MLFREGQRPLSTSTVPIDIAETPCVKEISEKLSPKGAQEFLTKRHGIVF